MRADVARVQGYRGRATGHNREPGAFLLRPRPGAGPFHRARPREGVSFGFRRVIPARGSETETVRVPVPGDAAGPIVIRARLLYRSVPPRVVREVLGARGSVPEIVVMAEADAEVRVE